MSFSEQIDGARPGSLAKSRPKLPDQHPFQNAKPPARFSHQDVTLVRVLCALENAATVINGVKFAAVKAGMLSEEIPLYMAEEFASIPGYSVIPQPKTEAKQVAAEPAGSADTAKGPSHGGTTRPVQPSGRPQ